MRYILALVLSLTWGSVSAQVDEPGAGIQSVISKQIQAFQRDDFEAAFQFASPNIQGMFGDSDRFGLMVRQGYPMVWQPDEVRFLELQRFNDAMLQQVMIRDQAGVIHVLVYQMEMIEGDWRINGVQLMRANQEAV